MSTQWGPDPYFYPIQIAQYALQHYSRNFTGKFYFIHLHCISTNDVHGPAHRKTAAAGRFQEKIFTQVVTQLRYFSHYSQQLLQICVFSSFKVFAHIYVDNEK
jgi:hypothetical protein